MAFAPKIFGHEFNLVWFPQEVTYPFPTILFFGLEPQQETNSLLTQKAISCQVPNGSL